MQVEDNHHANVRAPAAARAATANDAASPPLPHDQCHPVTLKGVNVTGIAHDTDSYATRSSDNVTRMQNQGAVDTAGCEIITRQGSHTMPGLMAGYDFAPGWNATLNLDNVTNRKYIGNLYRDQGYYGAPCSWMLNVSRRL